MESVEINPTLGNFDVKKDQKTSLNSTETQSHWDQAYTKTSEESLGWYESDPKLMIDLINACQLPKNSPILIAGSGSTLLLDKLHEEGYSKLIATDISEVALSQLESRIGPSGITYILDDLTQPKSLKAIEPVKLWIDRAVLHFFLEKEEQENYFDLIKEKLLPDGFVIFAEFNLSGAEKCSGLPVLRYSSEMLQNQLGKDFKLLKSFDFDFINPSGGVRPYIYTLFQRIS